MKEQFVTYEQALALKELEFSDRCCAFYIEPIEHRAVLMMQSQLTDYEQKNLSHCISIGDLVPAPTYSQAFRHFRERFKLSSHTDLASVSHLGENYYYQILNFADLISPETTFKVDGFESQEEAESACLDKLIQFLS